MVKKHFKNLLERLNSISHPLAHLETSKMQKKSQRVAKTRAGAGQDAQEGRQGGRHPHAAVVTAVNAPGLLPHIYI